MSAAAPIATGKTAERCLLVAVSTENDSRYDTGDHLNELSSLAYTAGVDVVDTILQDRLKPDPAYYIGRGKADELKLRISEEDIDVVIFDDELSPAQVRNLERLTKIKIIDRTGLILDIFAAHARTRQSSTQVELAQLNYLLPRLTRQWTHLSRQNGGIGTKGPGETQLETDRRLVRTRISRLQQILHKIEKQKSIQRSRQQSMFRVALVGYTNAGKSTLLNALTGAEILVEDKLFATLDTTTRRMQVVNGQDALLSDTVGFIRKLPHHLVASFKTTLSQASEADMLMHVVDVSHPKFEDHISVVQSILKDLELTEKPMLMVFNKVDRLKTPGLLVRLQGNFQNAVFISARQGIRLEKVRHAILEFMQHLFFERQITLPYAQSHLEHKLSTFGHILHRNYEEHGIVLTVRVLKEKEALLNHLLNQHV